MTYVAGVKRGCYFVVRFVYMSCFKSLRMSIIDSRVDRPHFSKRTPLSTPPRFKFYIIFEPLPYLTTKEIQIGLFQIFIYSSNLPFLEEPKCHPPFGTQSQTPPNCYLGNVEIYVGLDNITIRSDVILWDNRLIQMMH